MLKGEDLVPVKVTHAVCKEPFHENEELQYYCKDCTACICLKCRQTRHKQHSQVDIQEAADEKKAQWRKVIDKAKADVVFLESRIEEQNRLIDIRRNEIIAEQNKVSRNVEDLVSLLREKENEMKMQIEKIGAKQQKNTSNAPGKLEIARETTDNFN